MLEPLPQRQLVDQDGAQCKAACIHQAPGRDLSVDTYRSGGVGLRCAESTRAHFDDFPVKTLTKP
jgi:hypothetical protein